MPSSAYQATGVLSFDGNAVVTPIIRALFSQFKLSEAHPNLPNQCYIANMGQPVDWQNVLKGIRNEASNIDIALAAEAHSPGEELAQWMSVLGEKFGATDEEFLAFAQSFADDDLDENAHLSTLFDLANRFNDGHNLISYEIEGCWHSDKPLLNEFGGNGEFVSKHIHVTTSSQDAITLGGAMDRAIAANQFGAATRLMTTAVQELLDTIQDDSVRQLIAQSLAKTLAVAPAAKISEPGPHA